MKEKGSYFKGNHEFFHPLKRSFIDQLIYDGFGFQHVQVFFLPFLRIYRTFLGSGCFGL